MKPVVLLGGGGHAAVVLDVLELNAVPVAGYLALSPSDLDIPYLGDDSWLTNTAAADYQLALGVGSIRVSPLRQQLFERAKAMGFDAAKTFDENLTSLIAENSEEEKGGKAD